MRATRRAVLHGAFSSGAGLILGCGANGPNRSNDDDGTGGGFTSSVNGAGGAATGSGAGGGGGVATSGSGTGGAGGDPVPPCDDPFEGGRLLGYVDFVSDDSGLPKNTLTGQGWDARLYTDLAQLDEGNLVVPNDSFFVRTRYPDLLNESAPWTIDVKGLVNTTKSLTMADLTPLVKPQGVHIMECSGNFKDAGFGLLSAAEWSGVPFQDVLDMIDIAPSATRVLVSGFDGHSVPSAGGHSTPGASWVFTFQQLAGAFLATEMNGEPLPKNHGKPVRLLVPGWYGCSCIKWVDEIVLVDDDAPATSQMKEFASRTHQNGVPQWAEDYKPASIDQAAMPIRLEKWQLNGEIVYKVIGIMWGGYEPTDKLQIRFNDDPLMPVDVCPKQTSNAAFNLWIYKWKPQKTGYHNIDMQIDDPSIPTKRLDDYYYVREFYIDEI